MPVLNHHIVAAGDKEATARYFTEILGLGPAVRLGEFAVLRVSPDTTLDLIDSEGDFDRLHYAFLVTEAEFDKIFSRVKGRHIPYWSDPMHNDPDAINTWDTDAGCTSMTPTGTGWRLTPPYGSAGTAAKHPHPLVAPIIDGSEPPRNAH